MGKVQRMLAVWILSCILSGYLAVNASAEEISLKIDAGEPGQKTASFSVGQQHSWQIRARLRGEWEGITILQTLPIELTLDTASVGVHLANDNGEQILLRMEEHYTLTAGSVFVEAGMSDRLCISLTKEGLLFLSEYMTPASELVVSYRAKINTGAQMGRQIVAIAQMNLTDSEGKKIIFLSDKSAVSTGGMRILLSDTTGKPFGGGHFMLAREATPEELEDSRYEIEILETGIEPIAVLYEQFYTSEDLQGSKTDIAVTDANGMAICYGLAYGTYYLVQTDSAREDLLPSKPIKVQINEVSHLTAEDGWTDSLGNIEDNTIHITGTALVMPNTGGPGTIPYTVSGAAVIFCACLLLWYNRKRTVIT